MVMIIVNNHVSSSFCIVHSLSFSPSTQQSCEFHYVDSHNSPCEMLRHKWQLTTLPVMLCSSYLLIHDNATMQLTYFQLRSELWCVPTIPKYLSTLRRTPSRCSRVAIVFQLTFLHNLASLIKNSTTLCDRCWSTGDRLIVESLVKVFCTGKLFWGHELTSARPWRRHRLTFL